MSIASRLAGVVSDFADSRARYGTRNGHRIRPRNCTTLATTPTAPAANRIAGAAPCREAETRIASGVSSAAVIANPHQSSTRAEPPALNFASTSAVGLRRMFG